MTGIVAAGVGIGGFIGPPMARWLISMYGWRVSYIIMSGIVLVFVVLSAQIMRRDPSQVGQTADGKRGTEESVDPHWKGGLSLKEAIQTRQFWLINANFFCFGFCVFSIMVHIAPHATELGISAASAASILATVCAFGIVGKILFGRAGDVFGSRVILIFGFILISAVLCFLAGAKAAWGLYTFACIFGVAFGGCAVSHPPLVASLFGLSSLGVVLGVVNLGFSLGGAIGPFVTGYVFDVAGSYQMAFLICALFSAIGFIVVAMLRPLTVKPE
jgi:MFS family permease